MYVVLGVSPIEHNGKYPNIIQYAFLQTGRGQLEY